MPPEMLETLDPPAACAHPPSALCSNPLISFNSEPTSVMGGCAGRGTLGCLLAALLLVHSLFLCLHFCMPLLLPSCSHSTSGRGSGRYGHITLLERPCVCAPVAKLHQHFQTHLYLQNCDRKGEDGPRCGHVSACFSDDLHTVYVLCKPISFM